jgi:serpin B
MSWFARAGLVLGLISSLAFGLSVARGLCNQIDGRLVSALGMDAGFNKGCGNFERMCSTPQNVDIGKAKHKTLVEVNEESTEAAAVTSVEIKAMAMPPAGHFTMIVDHPFFFAIRDNRTGTVLFMGSIVEPK